MTGGAGLIKTHVIDWIWIIQIPTIILIIILVGLWRWEVWVYISSKGSKTCETRGVRVRPIKISFVGIYDALQEESKIILQKPRFNLPSSFVKYIY